MVSLGVSSIGEVDGCYVQNIANEPEYVRDVTELQGAFPGVTDVVEMWFVNYKGPGEMESRGLGPAAEGRRAEDAARRAHGIGPWVLREAARPRPPRRAHCPQRRR